MDEMVEEQKFIINIFCTRCIRTITVTDLSQLMVGDHICYFGRFGRCNFGLFKWSAYLHHDIVSEADALSVFSGKIKVIGFQDCEHEICSHVLINYGICRCRKGLRVQEEEIHVDLELSSLKIISYKGAERTIEEYNDRVETAKRLLKTNPEYNVCVFNCEHFCHLVCAGVPDSHQVRRLRSVPNFV